MALGLNTALAFQVPALQGPVMDQVGLLSQSAAQKLSQQIRQQNSQGAVQAQILILNSLDGESIEQAAIQIFDQWKLGDAKKDNGILILAAIQDRKMRIEVGRGLEGALPDVVAKRIIAEIMRPLFKSGNFDAGFILATQAVFEAAATETNGQVFNVESFKEKILTDPGFQTDLNKRDLNSLNQSGSGSRNGEGSKIPLVFVILILFGLWLVILVISPSTALWILFSLLSGGRGGGHGGGGGWSGGGGSSGGGGASGDW